MPAVAARILSLGDWKRRFGERQPVCPPPGHYAQLDRIARNPPKMNSKQFGENDWGHAYTCNNLTSFQCEVNTNHRKRKLCQSAEDCVKKIVKSQQVNFLCVRFYSSGQPFICNFNKLSMLSEYNHHNGNDLNQLKKHEKKS